MLFLFLGDEPPDLGEQGVALGLGNSGNPRFGAEPRAVLGLVLFKIPLATRSLSEAE